MEGLTVHNAGVMASSVLLTSTDLLYQLLTMRMPYTASNTNSYALATAICEQEPAKPRVNEDIDNIILKTLQKDPSRRYSSALELENEIDRYLRGMPVTARGDTLIYRASKFVARHKRSTATVAAAAVLIVAAIEMTLIQYRVAQAERLAVQRRSNDVRSLADSFVSQVDGSIADLPGSTLARQTLAKTALENLERLYQESGHDRELQRELAAAYEKMAGVLESPGWASTGGTSAALELWSKALKMREERAAMVPSDLIAKKEWAESITGFSLRMELTDTKKALD